MKLACLSLILASLLPSPVSAQTATLRGQVTDESGAVVPGANVMLAGPAGLARTTSAGNDGSYSFADLPLGSYTVQASAPSLILRQPAKISLKGGVQTLNLLLNVGRETAGDH
jgi:Carboxypeptidase regulatory-like domain